MGCRSAGFVLIVLTVPGAVCENGRLAALLLGLESPHILQYAAGFSPRAPRAGMLREQRFCHQEEVFGCGTAEALEAEEVEVPARGYPEPAA